MSYNLTGEEWAERVTALEERVAHAEVARDNALVMRDEVMALKQRAGESAGRRIEALIKLARHYAHQAETGLVGNARTLVEDDLASILAKDAPAPTSEEKDIKVLVLANEQLGRLYAEVKGERDRCKRERDDLADLARSFSRGVLAHSVERDIAAILARPTIFVVPDVDKIDPKEMERIAASAPTAPITVGALRKRIEAARDAESEKVKQGVRTMLEHALYAFIIERNGTSGVEDQYEVAWHLERLDEPSKMNEMANDLDDRQKKIHEWCKAAFGVENATYLPQRALRLFEEATEMCQAAGAQPHQLFKYVNYVYSRPIGDVRQEVGGVFVTLLAMAQAAGFSADEALADEEKRIYSKPLEHFAKRNAEKDAAGFKATRAETEK